MPNLLWVLAGGAAMSLLALTGSLTLLLPERTFKQLVLPLVAVAAGSLLGGAHGKGLERSLPRFCFWEVRG